MSTILLAYSLHISALTVILLTVGKNPILIFARGRKDIYYLAHNCCMVIHTVYKIHSLCKIHRRHFKTKIWQSQYTVTGSYHTQTETCILHIKKILVRKTSIPWKLPTTQFYAWLIVGSKQHITESGLIKSYTCIRWVKCVCVSMWVCVHNTLILHRHSMRDSVVPGELEENLESYTDLNWDFWR